ncbi:NAD(P)-dependent oxidoreductase [Brucella sp. BE17]|uniref:NAD-dependent epimerase/dehydratase family protein n=1 Tax=Brucella sp. BE17 TaxID=3142977 RepID=UPI0031B9C17D
MTILITGATGLVGARLLKRLAETGQSCRALVRAGKPVPASVDGVEGDLFDLASLATALREVSAVIHLAAVFRTHDTDLIWKSNLEGTRNLIGAASQHAPQARFIMASTGNVYDRNCTHPSREDDEVHPEQAYPASKIAAEKLLRESELNWSIVRLPFVYGDGDGHLQALPRYVKPFGFHPAHRMSTVHHRDVATAMRLALEGRFDGQIVNISDEAPTTVCELVRLVDGAMEDSAEPLTDPWFLHMDGALARKLGFQPEVRTVYQAAQEGLL